MWNCLTWEDSGHTASLCAFWENTRGEEWDPNPADAFKSLTASSKDDALIYISTNIWNNICYSNLMPQEYLMV